MNGNQLAAKRPINWKTFIILMALAIPATYIIIPFAMTLQGDAAIEQMAQTEVQMPLWLIFLINISFNAVLLVILGLLGMLMSSRLGLGLPFIEGQVTGKPIWKRLPRIFGLAMLIGVIGAVAVIGVDSAVYSKYLADLLNETTVIVPESIKPPAWQGFLASISAGVTEEIMFRLFGLTLITWLISLVFRREDGRPKLGALWIANILFAVAFGLAHLPATKAIGLPLNAMVVSRAILLNGLLGMAFGWLYWTYGLESAMFAHFSADVVLHVIFAWVVRVETEMMQTGIAIGGIVLLLVVGVLLMLWGRRMEAEDPVAVTV